MLFEDNISKLYSDTLVPDIFISEYMPGLDGDSIKLYIFLLYLKKLNKKVSDSDLAVLLNLESFKLKQAYALLEEKGIITRHDKHFVLNDLKEIEISKHFRLKTTALPEEAARHTENNNKRRDIINSINTRFFQGLMPITWYTDIDLWFDLYKFDEEVMFALFQHCSDYKALNKQYIQKVAAEWNKKGIKNYNQLERFLNEYEKFKDIRSKIVKKLKLGRNLTEYEEQYVYKWVMEFGYGFDIIELALMKTTGIKSPTINYIDGAISSWRKKGLCSRDDVVADIENFRSRKAQEGTAAQGGKHTGAPQKDNFDERQLDDEYFENLYANSSK